MCLLLGTSLPHVQSLYLHQALPQAPPLPPAPLCTLSLTPVPQNKHCPCPPPVCTYLSCRSAGSAQEPRRRAAALTVCAVLAEGCAEQLRKRLNQVRGVLSE
jgi:hypothetical protein